MENIPEQNKMSEIRELGYCGTEGDNTESSIYPEYRVNKGKHLKYQIKTLGLHFEKIRKTVTIPEQ